MSAHRWRRAGVLAFAAGTGFALRLALAALATLGPRAPESLPGVSRHPSSLVETRAPAAAPTLSVGEDGGVVHPRSPEPAAGAADPATPPPIDAWGDVSGVTGVPEVWDLYRRLDRGDELMALWGPHAVRPLGWSVRDFETWSRRGVRPVPVEAGQFVLHRLQGLSVEFPTRLREAPCALVAYASAGEMECVAGGAGWFATPPADEAWRRFVAHIPPSERPGHLALLEEIRPLTESVARARVESEHRLWTLAWPAIEARLQGGLHEADVIGLVVPAAASGPDGAPWIIRLGQDAGLDRLIFERDELERLCAARIRETLIE